MIVGVPNCHNVTPDIWRGAQPTQQGWDELWQCGVRRVAKLNTAKEGDESYALSIGMEVLAFPINIWQEILVEPPESLVTAAVASIIPGTFIHCGSDDRTLRWQALHNDTEVGGNDRTGPICAYFRIKMGWSKPLARGEMLTFGFHMGLVGLEMYWQTHS